MTRNPSINRTPLTLDVMHRKLTVMFRKLLEGFVFGVGFTAALILVAVLVMPQLMPISFRSSDRPAPIASERISAVPPPDALGFHDLPVEEQIKRSSAIALARFEPAPDGKMKAVIREFLKKDPNTVIHYKVGDEFAAGSFYPSETRSHGDGEVIFFVGSPAAMRMSMTYSGDRIHGLADIPIELFRKKCAAPDA